jgi:hypothetical protein
VSSDQDQMPTSLSRVLSTTMTGPERPIAHRAGAIAGIYEVLTLFLVGVSLQATLGSENFATVAPPSQATVDIIDMLNDVPAMAEVAGIWSACPCPC